MASKDTRKTPVFDWEAGEFALDAARKVRTSTGAEAVIEVVTKAQQTIRGAYLIYGADPEVSGSKGHTYGSDVDTVRVSDLPTAAKLSEMERAVKDAIMYDPWVKDVRDITVTRQGSDEALITATIDHIYGTDDLTFTV